MDSERKNKIRLLSFLILSIFVYSVNNFFLLSLLLLGSFAIFFILKTPKRYIKGLIYANYFTVFVVASLLIIDFKGNLSLATTIFIKSNILLLLGFSLILPMGMFNLVKTLESLGVPKKFSLMVLLSYRYLETFREEYGKMKKAAACRGFEPKLSLSTYRTYGYLLGSLTLKSFLKSKEIYKAMLLRGLED